MTCGHLGLVEGRVQGVWFRRFVQRAAVAEGVEGYAKNLADGRVEVYLIGNADAINRVKQQVAIGPRGAKVRRISWQTVRSPQVPVAGFQIL